MEAVSPDKVRAEDERAVTAVILRYATAIDTQDWRLLRSCFSDDFEGDFGSFGSWRGPREIADFMREAHAPLGPTLHRITNIVVQEDEGHVRARSYVDALLMPATPGGPIHRGIGWYDDQMVRTSDGWKIARRTFVPVRLD
jgi:3-phenylpropionate/cinnamic acid dioxygenase small subunit